jgi:hypothetical protein
VPLTVFGLMVFFGDSVNGAAKKGRERREELKRWDAFLAREEGRTVEVE